MRDNEMSEVFAIVIPAHNESKTIGRIVSRCRSHSPFVLVVDDGSVDSTGSVARAAGGRIINVPQQSGVGHALQLGFHEARKLGSDIVVTMDGDGAHDPDLVPRLVDFHIARRADLTIGSRFLDPTARGSVPDSKLAANHFASHLINAALGSSFSDVASGMRVLGRAALDVQCRVWHFEFPYEHLAAAFRMRLKIAECAITVRYNADRLLCTSVTELTDLLEAAIHIVGDTDASLARRISFLRGRVSARAVLRVLAGAEHLIAHPLAEYDSYLFQFQEACFVEPAKGEEWITLD